MPDCRLTRSCPWSLTHGAMDEEARAIRRDQWPVGGGPPGELELGGGEPNCFRRCRSLHRLVHALAASPHAARRSGAKEIQRAKGEPHPGDFYAKAIRRRDPHPSNPTSAIGCCSDISWRRACEPRRAASTTKALDRAPGSFSRSGLRPRSTNRWSHSR